MAVVQEAYVQGVSTRPVDELAPFWLKFFRTSRDADCAALIWGFPMHTLA